MTSFLFGLGIGAILPGRLMLVIVVAQAPYCFDFSCSI